LPPCPVPSAAAAVGAGNSEADSLKAAEEEDLDPHLENGREAFVLRLHHSPKAPPSQLLLRWVSPSVFHLALLFLLLVVHNSIDTRRET